MSRASAASPTASPTSSRPSPRAGFAFETIVASGGAAASPLVRQIVADACGMPVAVARDARACPARLGDDRRGRVGARDRDLRDGVDVGARRAASSRRAARSPPFTPASAAPSPFSRARSAAARAAMREARWPEVVIFDCDGVLVDSELIALGVTRRMLGEAGLALSDEETRERFLGMRQDGVLERIEKELGRAAAEGFSAALAREILATFERELKGVDGVRQAVERARRPRLRRLVERAAAAPLRAARDRLRSLFAPNIFSSAEVQRGKPWPDLFLFAARAMGAAPHDCLVIEDSVAGVTAARAAGMTAFGFVGASHFSEPAQGEELTAAGAALIFADMARLPELVAEWRRAGRRGRRNGAQSRSRRTEARRGRARRLALLRRRQHPGRDRAQARHLAPGRAAPRVARHQRAPDQGAARSSDRPLHGARRGAEASLRPALLRHRADRPGLRPPRRSASPRPRRRSSSAGCGGRSRRSSASARAAPCAPSPTSCRRWNARSTSWSRSSAPPRSTARRRSTT